MSFKIQVMLMVDFERMSDKSHKSISGGIATHSFTEIGSHSVATVEEVLPKIKDVYGFTPYIFDNRLEIQVSDYDTMSFYITEVQEIEYDNTLLKVFFPQLKEN